MNVLKVAFNRLWYKIAPSLFFMAFLLVCNLATPVNAEQAPVSIAVVNVRYLLQNAPQTEEASKDLQQRFQQKERELDTENARIVKLEEAFLKEQNQLNREEKLEREREIRSLKRKQNRAVEDYREDLRLARNTALEDVQKVVFKSIDEVRRKKNIDIIIQEFVSASDRADITDDVLKHLEAQQLQQQNMQSGEAGK